MAQKNLQLIGCGVLQKEIRALIGKNNWPIETFFLDSMLHSDYTGLARELNSAIVSHRQIPTVVFYGCCHPRMDDILHKTKTFRTEGQNCAEMLLGKALFMQELEQGAYFLFEDFAQRWNDTVALSLGTEDQKIVKEIFQEDRKYLCGLKTPCSGDFAREAEAVSANVGLPLRWIDCPLDNLESVLREVLHRKMEGVSWEK